MDHIPSDILLNAYAQGVFPMANDGELSWYSPEMRGIIPLDDRFHINRGLKKALRKQLFTVRRNTAFEDVMRACAERTDTWIDETIIASYCSLHDIGHAHSIECWDADGLQGGLYGVSLEGAFFGESMFSRKTDASKIALVHLVNWLRDEKFQLLDTQWITDHLRTFGGIEVPRAEYLELLKSALQQSNK